MSSEEYAQETGEHVEVSQETQHHEEGINGIAGNHEAPSSDQGDAAAQNGEHAAAAQGGAQHASGELAGAEEEDSITEANVADMRIYLEEMHRIDETMMSVIRSLSAMTNVEDEDVRANLSEVCADIQAEEMGLFSPMPDDIADIIDKENKVRTNKIRGVQPHDDIPRASAVYASNFDTERRAFVDPGVPLSLPYSLERERKNNPNRNGAISEYHDLFHGDGSQCVFPPPENNKRKQLEAERLAHQRKPRPPVSYEPPPRKTLRVSSDFVPSCAVGASASQRDSGDPAYRRSSGFKLRNYKPAPKTASKPKKTPFP